MNSQTAFRQPESKKAKQKNRQRCPPLAAKATEKEETKPQQELNGLSVYKQIELNEFRVNEFIAVHPPTCPLVSGRLHTSRYRLPASIRGHGKPSSKKV